MPSKDKKPVRKCEPWRLTDPSSLPPDLLSSASISQLRDYIHYTIGALDVCSSETLLVNNAGVAWRGPELIEEIASFTLGTNTATVTLTEPLLPVLKPRAHIVMVSSGQLERISGHAVRSLLAGSDLTVEAVKSLADSFIQSVINGSAEAKGWGHSTFIASKNL